MQSADTWERRQRSRLLSRGGHGLSTAKSPVRGESPRARYPIALAPSIRAWRVLAEDLLSIVKPRQRGCSPLPVHLLRGDPTMPPHHIKAPGPRGCREVVHTQGGVHTRRFVATARAVLFKGVAGAGPHVERNELKRGFLARVGVRVSVGAGFAIGFSLGLGMGLLLLVHIWGLSEGTGQSAVPIGRRPTVQLDGSPFPLSSYVCRRPCPVYSGKVTCTLMVVIKWGCPSGPALVWGGHEDGGCACTAALVPHWKAHLVHCQLPVAQQMGAVPLVGPLTRVEPGGASPFVGEVLRQIRLLGLLEAAFGPCALPDPLLGHCHLPLVFRAVEPQKAIPPGFQWWDVPLICFWQCTINVSLACWIVAKAVDACRRVEFRGPWP